MKISIDGATKEIKLLNDYKQRLISVENSSKVWVSTDVDKDSDRPDYDFIKTHENIMNTVDKICKIKHAVNVFNTTHILPCGRTIDEALVRLSAISERVATLKRMALIQEKTRMTHVNGEGKMYQYRNYDMMLVEDELDALQHEMIVIQTQLNYANMNNFIDI